MSKKIFLNKKKKRTKRNAKDSVFCKVFSEKRYQKDLIETLAPSIGEVDEEKIESITIKNVLTNQLHIQ